MLIVFAHATGFELLTKLARLNKRTRHFIDENCQRVIMKEGCFKEVSVKFETTINDYALNLIDVFIVEEALSKHVG